MNPAELFELVWGELLIENILDPMKLYSIWKGKEVFVASKAKFRTFFRIIILSGYNKLSGVAGEGRPAPGISIVG